MHLDPIWDVCYFCHALFFLFLKCEEIKWNCKCIKTIFFCSAFYSSKDKQSKNSNRIYISVTVERWKRGVVPLGMSSKGLKDFKPSQQKPRTLCYQVKIWLWGYICKTYITLIILYQIYKMQIATTHKGIKKYKHKKKNTKYK